MSKIKSQLSGLKKRFFSNKQTNVRKNIKTKNTQTTSLKKVFALILCLIVLSVSGSLLAQNGNNSYFNRLTSAIVGTTPTPKPQTVRPKRKKTENPKKDGLVENDLASRPLATTEFNLVGLAVTANPANQTVPKNTPTGILTSVKTPEGTDPSEIIAGLNPNYKVRGELVGPSFTSPQVVETSIGQTISIPPLQNAGDHVVQNLRVVDTGSAGEPVITAVEPDSVGINVIDNLLVSEVNVTEMNYEQIVQSGINITGDNYRFFNFTLGLVTSSGTVPINIPIAFPNTGGQDPPVIGNPVGVGVDGVEIPSVLPVMLSIQNEDGDEDEETELPELPGGGQVNIPGAVIFPGRIGLLNQFFEAIVIVSNGAPDGTPLVITNLKATANLPDGGTPSDANDDPLRIAETQQAGQVDELPLHGLGPDEEYGTADDVTSFSPGQAGQASFLIEGLKEGLHTINFDLEGTLSGLPTGPVTVVGSVPGAVLVKDVDFSVSFTHPATVRAGQEYDLGLSIYNSGSRDLQNIFAELRSNSISGAELIDTERKDITETIRQGETATIKWRMRSNVTGAVTATYTKVGEEIESGLNLVTGVGDRNVPLSPESLILPPPVEKLSPNIVEAARQMLGQSWSVANAPPGGLPAGVLPINKQVVISKAIELGFAGLRVDFGESEDASLQTLMRDWLGENGTSTNGFADSLKNTPAGYYFYDSVGTKFYEGLNSGQTTDIFNQKLSESESPRSSFISAIVTQDSGSAKFGAKLIAPNGRIVGWGADNTDRVGELRKGFGIDLLQNDPRSATNETRGKYLHATEPEQGNWQLEITGWETGVADISILVPTSGKDYRQINYDSLSIESGKKYRVTFRNNGQNLPIIEELIGGTYQTISNTPAISNIFEKDPRVIGSVQVTPDVVSGGDKFGRLVGVLFSKPMTQESVENSARYEIGGGNLVGASTPTLVGKPIDVTGASQNFGKRFAIIALETPVGPFIERNVKTSGIVDESGRSIFNVITDINMRVSPQGTPPGAYVTGRVLNADGTLVPNALVTYQTDERGNFSTTCPGGIKPNSIATRIADENGEFQLDYVREGYCLPVSLNVTNVATSSQKTLRGNIIYNGQHLTVDAVFLARGNVSGTVTTSTGQPLADANVAIIPELDPSNGKIVQTDAAGNYQAEDIAVGNVVVKAVGTGDFSLASGISAGTIEGPGATAVVNITTQNINGKISGKVINSDAEQTPVNGALVVAKATIPGFSTPIAVGYSFTNPDGDFEIPNLPVGNVFLSVIDPANSVQASTTVQLTSQDPEAENVIIAMPGFGSISGKVTNEIGQPIESAIVSTGGQAVLTDAQGNYTFPMLREGNYSILAKDLNSSLTGSASISLQSGENKTNINISIKRPGTITGQVSITENGTTQPLAGVVVTIDGRNFVETSANGDYQIENVPPGNAKIRFVKIDRKLFINTSTVVNSDEIVIRNATFRPGRIYGKVTQPDGAAVVAPVTLRVQIARLTPGTGFGFPVTDAQIQILTDANGDYSVPDINPGDYIISSSNEFFPIRVSKAGDLPPSGEHEVNLQLVDTLAGKISGHIYKPDGVTKVGAGVNVALGGGTLADITVRTDENGYYEFAEVFAEGNYKLSATDPITSFTNQASIAVQQNQDLVADLTLLGRGNLKVNVVDGAGNPVPNGSISLKGSSYPNDERFAELVLLSNGSAQFNNLTQGVYAISANYTLLGGRGTATVTNGGLTEVTIQVQSTGKVEGRVLMPDGTTPIGLADVSLKSGGRTIGFLVSSDTEEDRGKFTFDNVVEGDFTIDVFDNRTGRSGRAFGTISEQGEVVNIDVRLMSRGNVVGQVTSNGTPVDHALVELYTYVSGIGITRIVTTTDSQGNYRFTGVPVGSVSVTVTNGPGGLSGSASGTVSGTNEPLPDTVINVPLTPTATVKGKVYKLGGTEVFSGATVRIIAGSGSSQTTRTTTTDLNGDYQVNFVPLGTIKVSATAPSGFDRGQAVDVTATQAGAIITSDVVMNGVGTINGTALDSDGTLLNRGTVTFTNNDFGNVRLTTSVQSDGTYKIMDAPTGNYALKLELADRVGVGTATGTLNANQTLDIPLQLEPAGKVTGKVLLSDGTTPAAGADITLFLVKQSNGSGLIFRTHADAQGDWTLDNLPLGNVSITISEFNSGGVASLGGLVLDTNGQTLDTGTVNLDDTPISVVSVIPNDTTVDVATNSQVEITFNEPVRSNTVSAGTVRLLQGTSAVDSTRTISPDGTKVTIAPNVALEDAKVYTVVVTTSVKDLNGLSLLQQFESTFTTADETAPSISSIAPASSSNQIPLDTQIVLVADEELDATQDFSSLVQVSDGQNNISGHISLDPTGKIITFAPSANLNESTTYTVTVNGLKDLSENTQTQAFVSSFTTIDTTAPIVNSLPIHNTSVRTYTPTITATYSDNTSGINTSSVVLTLDGNNVTSQATVTGGGLSYTPSQPITAGSHTITVQVADNVGNTSAVRTANFTIDDSGPIISTFTIGGVPATNGAPISTSLTPLFEINYTDDTGINAIATKLYLGYNGATPTEVAATVTNTQLTYQSATAMAEGDYVVRAVIENNLGTSTDTGEISFTLDPDAPDIQTVTPPNGNQHGGTVVTLEGLRLLNTNGTAPTVTIGNNPTTVTSATLGTGGNPDTVLIRTPAGVPGNAIIKVTTDRGTGNGAFSYDIDPKTPFAAEPDTRLLWHLDELTNGSTRIVDSNYLSIDGTANSNSTAVDGRFAGGRIRSFIKAEDDLEELDFPNESFTVETWVKTGNVGRTYTLAGKGYLLNGNPSRSTFAEYLIEILPSGAIQARAFSGCWNCGGVEWQAEMASTDYDVDDDQWHLITMTVDRTTDLLKLYVDGVERASTPKPATFGAVRTSNNNSFFAGYYNSQRPSQSGTTDPREFPGVLDEIRVSSTAHDASKVLNDYLGTQGGNGLEVYTNSLLLAPLGKITTIDLTGYGLAGVVASANDSSNSPINVEVISSSSNHARLEVSVSNEAALGDATLNLSSIFGIDSLTFRIFEPERSIFGAEPDTRLLWHLDELTNGSVRINGSSQYSNDGTANSNSLATEGLFAGGRTRSFIKAEEDYGTLDFPNESFTVETWVKTGNVGRTYTLAGKGYLLNGNPSRSTFAEYLIEILPSGAIQARAFSGCWNCGGVEWQAEMASTDYDVDDDQWHLITMTVDRTTDLLKLYVDGVERASTPKPATFGAVRTSNNNSFFAGYYNSQRPSQSGTTDPREFPGVLDEIRVSSTAHDASRIARDFEGNSELRVTYASPKIILREKENPIPVINQISLDGYELDNINAEVRKDGQLIDVIATVESSAYRQSILNLAVSQTAPLGDVQLIISKENQTSVTLDIRIIEDANYIVENDTVLLWHLDETGNGSVAINDAGLLSIDGTANSNSTAVDGRFAGGRTRSFIKAEEDYGTLDFPNESFTVETWVKTGNVGRTYTLAGKGYLLNGNPSRSTFAEYLIEILPSGAIQARAFSGCWNCGGVEWQAEMASTDYDVDDDQWHLITMTVDRTTDLLKLYVDGVERASTPKPATFGAVRTSNNNSFFAGYYNSQRPSQSGTTDPREFPGVLDEIRVSSTAHDASRIARDFIGEDGIRIVRANPTVVQKGANSLVKVVGFGLQTSTVTINNPEITLSTVSSNSSEINLSLNVTGNSDLGTSQLTFTDSQGNSVSTPITVVDQQAFVATPETKLLWHLDETGNGSVAINDAGLLSIDGTANSNSTAVDGRFAGGRIRSFIKAEDDLEELDFPNESFTVETWVKTGNVGRTYTLAGKGYLLNGNPSRSTFAEYLIEILPSGAIQARAFSGCWNCGGIEWQAEQPRLYDPQTGFWSVDINDNNWHLITMTVDRTTDLLKLYVDGVERASTPKPATFGAVRTSNNNSFFAGYYNSQRPSQSGTTDPREFPGVLDEIRVLDYARTPQEIADTWFGTGSNFSHLLKKSKKQNSKQAITKKKKPKPIPPKPPDKRKVALEKTSKQGRRAEESIRLDKR